MLKGCLAMDEAMDQPMEVDKEAWLRPRPVSIKASGTSPNFNNSSGINRTHRTLRTIISTDDDQAGPATHTLGKGPHRGLLRDLNSTLGRVRVRYQTMQTTGNVIYNLER